MRFQFAWQAQYLVKFEDDSCCASHGTGRFMCWTFNFVLCSTLWYFAVPE